MLEMIFKIIFIQGPVTKYCLMIQTGIMPEEIVKFKVQNWHPYTHNRIKPLSQVSK